MIGAVIITHGGLAKAFLDEACAIVGVAENVKAMEVKAGETTEEIRIKLKSAIKEVNKNDGVIIFTDMFGGTPTNIALSFLEEGKIEIITGVNMALLIKFLNSRGAHKLDSLVGQLVEYGHKSIAAAGSVLKGKK